ncbi:MAG: hypothetical protein LBP85_08080 [Prevotellaceae bacterium]|nr:hypothetical protein [Prevotellaceae bacterium]
MNLRNAQTDTISQGTTCPYCRQTGAATGSDETQIMRQPRIFKRRKTTAGFTNRKSK